MGLPTGATATWQPEYTPQVHLDPAAIAAHQFESPLPVLDVAGGSIQTILAGTGQVEIDMKEFKANMLPSGAVAGYSGTWVWGYVKPGTDVSAVRDTYTGPVVVATRGLPTEMKYVNDLGTTDTTHVLAYKYSTDQSLHWANPNMVDRYVPNPFSPNIPAWLGTVDHYSGAIPAAAHLHGAEDPAAIDGGPDSWFLSDGSMVGPAFYSKGWDGKTPQNYAIYRYPNVQEAAPIWFHDHTMGATRLNVYMGLAGGYLLVDPNLKLPAGLNATGLRGGALGNSPNDDTLIPLVIQDRSFDTNGQLFFTGSGPTDPTNPSLNPQHPYWSPEFFGDTIAVNGKVWPSLNVKAQRYEFLTIDGSNARSYILSFQNTLDAYAPGYTAADTNSATPTIWQVATDQGYLDKPVAVDPLVIMPGERAQFIIDFSGIDPGTNLVLHNFGPDAPLNVFPVDPADQNDKATTGKVMQFKVVAGAPSTDSSFNPATADATIRSGDQQIVRLANPATGKLAAGVNPDLTRELTLVEIANENPTTVNGVTYTGGPLEVLVNNSTYDGLRPLESNPNEMKLGKLKPVNGGRPDGTGNWLTEMPAEGTTEVWEIVNTTMDAHPIHTHLAQFQLLNRQSVNMGDFAVSGSAYIDTYKAAFPGGSFIPAYGPPLQYGPTKASGGKYGGNPDVTPFLTGDAIPPNANEAGWKDTVMVPPGMVTRFVVRWAPTDLPVTAKPYDLHYAFVPNDLIPGSNGATFDYVWHCHIVDHEDNEMMRPDAVIPRAGVGVREFRIGIDY